MNLVDRIWADQPDAPSGEVHLQPTRFSGKTVKVKLRELRRSMADVGAQAHVVTTLDSIAWLFNIRGRDVDYNPVAISYALVTAKDAYLFVDLKKLSPKVRRSLEKVTNIYPYEDMQGVLKSLNKQRAPVLLDPKTCNQWVAGKLRSCSHIELSSPIVAMKSRKNSVEIEGMRRCHIRDGVAVVRFLRWLKGAVPKGGVTELSAAERLELFRREGDCFAGLSFRTISGYRHHGAIVHYSVTPETDIPLKAEGLYLVDSGGQYFDGTTDITRTVLLGKTSSAQERNCYTRVLKGHIALARAVFPEGVNGLQLDTLARTELWRAGLDYGHGTGHGVGSHLNVHEGPQSISIRGHVPLEEGNILSNEPGYYEDGSFGIRIENLVLVERDQTLGVNGNSFFRFETLTLAPIDQQLIETSALNQDERSWVDNYHKRVYQTLSPQLAPGDRRWLKQETAALG